MLSLIFNAIIFAIVGVGLVEFSKSLIPATANVSITTKTIISFVIEVVVAILGVLAFAEGTIVAKIATVVATVGIAQVGYETVVKFIKKLTEFLKSKITVSK